jgi:hypothetical protein
MATTRKTIEGPGAMRPAPGPRKCTVVLSARNDELLSLESKRLRVTRSDLVESILARHFAGARIYLPGDPALTIAKDEAAA